MSHRVLSTVLLLACNPPNPPDPSPPPDEETSIPTTEVAPPSSEEDPPTTTTTPCTVSIGSSTPADGDDAVYYRAPVRVVLSEPDPTAVVTVTRADGVAVVGTSTVEDTTVTWIGEPLEPLSDYTVDVVYTCGTDQLGFTTSEVGVPVSADLTSRVYALDLAAGLWTEPPGVGPVFAAVFAPYRLRMGVTDMSDPLTLGLIAALSEDGDQYPCAPSLDLVGGVWADPYLEVSSPRVALETATFGLVIDTFSLGAAFAPDGSRIEGAVLAGVVDTRALGAQLGLGDSPFAVCQVAATLGAYCSACADGELVCLDLRVEDVDGPQVAESVEVITADDVAANPLCR